MNQLARRMCLASLAVGAVTVAWLSTDRLEFPFFACLLFYGALAALAAARLSVDRGKLHPARVLSDRVSR